MEPPKQLTAVERAELEKFYMEKQRESIRQYVENPPKFNLGSKENMLTEFQKSTKLSDTAIRLTGILKDRESNVSFQTIKHNPWIIFSQKIQSPYAFVELAKEQHHQIADISGEVKIVVAEANKKYNMWSALTEDASSLRPSFYKFRDSFSAFITKYNYHYGLYPYVDAVGIGFFYEIVFGIVMMVVGIILCVILYPTLNIFDCVSGRDRAFAEYINGRFADNKFEDSGMIDSAIGSKIIKLSEDLQSTSPEFKVVRGLDTFNFAVLVSGYEDDKLIQHFADCWKIALVALPQVDSSPV